MNMKKLMMMKSKNIVKVLMLYINKQVPRLEKEYKIYLILLEVRS